MAQGEGRVWYFGQNAGIHFNSGTVDALADGSLNSYEACASVSDKNGNLLFYTDGISIWNRAHVQMANGDALKGNQSSTQSVLILRAPGSLNTYYVFTTEGKLNGAGMRYTVVDMSRNGGMGEVVAKNTPLLNNSSEKLTAVRHRNERDYWVISHQINNDQFYAFLVTPYGIEKEAVVSRVGLVHKISAGYMKASLKGNKLACANTNFSLELFDFDNGNGKLSNPIQLKNIGSELSNVPSAYGLEFSPNGNLLYVSIFGDSSRLIQFSLLALTPEEIEDSKIILSTEDKAIGALLLGPDYRIYVSRYNSTALGVIRNPNEEGPGCDYDENGLNLGSSKSSIGLPNFHNAYVETPDLIQYQFICLGQETKVYIESVKDIDSIRYSLFDQNGNSTSSNGDTVYYQYPDAGEYEVEATIYFEGEQKRLYSTIVILDVPEIFLFEDTLLCKNQSLILDISEPYATSSWNGSRGSFINIRENGTYQIRVANVCGADSLNVSVAFEDCICELYVPNAFSPNGNELNEKFNVIPNCELQYYHLLIFDRWGNQVYDTEAVHIGWNGMYKEDPIVKLM